MKDKAQFTVQADACAVNLTQYFAVYLVFEHLFLIQCAPIEVPFFIVKQGVLWYNNIDFLYEVI